MKRRIGIMILALVLFLCPSMDVLACNENQTNLYVSKILFGDQSLQYETNKDVETLLNALYICSEQSDKAGQDKLNRLKRAKIRKLPALNDVNVSQYDLLRCAHNSWDYEAKKLEDKQDARKNVLKNTVVKIFDFGFFNELFKRDSGQIDSFSALLYYTHILADYIADDPKETAVSAKGYNIPSYTGSSQIEINGNIPSFTKAEMNSTKSYKRFSSLDSLNRAGAAMANIGPELLAPSNSRQNIGSIKPSGWNQKKYKGLVGSEPPYLYNRCHLIAHKLVNIDAEYNLITGTRYLNEAMENYENNVVAYIQNTGNHVLYRATPVYKGSDLVASGVQLEAYSIEDNGAGICFNVYFYNVQPGVSINYSNGSNERSDNIYGANDVIPFAVPYPNKENPDLMFKINAEMEKLFEGQKDSADFKAMMNDLNSIADEARRVSGDKDWKVYSQSKIYQYKYAEALTEHVPKLLANEKFFSSVFN